MKCWCTQNRCWLQNVKKKIKEGSFSSTGLQVATPMDSTGVHVDVVTSQPKKKDKEPKKKFVSVQGERDWSTGTYACFPDFPSCKSIFESAPDHDYEN